MMPPGIPRFIQGMLCLIRRVVCNAGFVRTIARLGSMFARMFGVMRL
jgi:hypothetical protein